jgi:hypothetical protein
VGTQRRLEREVQVRAELALGLVRRQVPRDIPEQEQARLGRELDEGVDLRDELARVSAARAGSISTPKADSTQTARKDARVVNPDPRG